MQETKKYYLEKIENIYEKIFNLDKQEIILLYQSLKKKSLEDLMLFYYKLIDRI